MARTSAKPKTAKTVIDDIYQKLAALLSPSEFRNSAEVIAAFEVTYPADWERLVTLFGHRDQIPGKKSRKRHYAASTYLADRLAAMKGMGYVDLEYVTDGYDQEVWKHSRRMGTWRLIREPDPIAGDWKFMTVRLPEETYKKLAAEAAQSNVSVATLAASRGNLVCIRHLARFQEILECLAVGISEKKRLGQMASGIVDESIVGTLSTLEDARDAMMNCVDCRTRYSEFRAVADASERRRARATAAGT
jgi:hypothetical protein